MRCNRLKDTAIERGGFGRLFFLCAGYRMGG
jgi:hypothetical protein